MPRMTPDDNRISAADEDANTPNWLVVASEYGEMLWDATVFVAFVGSIVGAVVWAVANSR